MMPLMLIFAHATIRLAPAHEGMITWNVEWVRVVWVRWTRKGPSRMMLRMARSRSSVWQLPLLAVIWIEIWWVFIGVSVACPKVLLEMLVVFKSS